MHANPRRPRFLDFDRGPLNLSNNVDDEDDHSDFRRDDGNSLLLQSNCILSILLCVCRSRQQRLSLTGVASCFTVIFLERQTASEVFAKTSGSLAPIQLGVHCK